MNSLTRETGRSILFLVVFVACFSGFRSLAAAVTDLELDTSELASRNPELPLVVKSGAGPFASALAFNVWYPPFQTLRLKLETHLGCKLDFFKAWNPAGEAHVTVITPPEYDQVLRPILRMDAIEAIAKKVRLQEIADLTILGLGAGKALVDAKEETTYFVIVESFRIREFRREVWREFVKRGGDPKAWSPDHYYPHVTVGFTRRDLHETDGVIKSAERSNLLEYRLILPAVSR